MNTLAKRIRARLDALKMTQTELAQRVGVSKGTVTLWVKGPTQQLEGQNLTRTALVLGVNAHWLATGLGEMLANAGTANGDVAHPESVYPLSQSQRQGLPALTPDEQALLDAYRLLEPADRDGLVMPLLEKASLIRRYLAKAQTQGSGPVASPTDPQGLQALIDRVCHPPDENDNNSA